METTYDTKHPANVGINYTGIPGAMVGKPAKGTDTGKWDEIILPPESVKDGTFLASRAIVVTSQGFATPATLGDFVRVTTNGNYVVKVKRDSLPDAVKQARKALSDAQKAAYKQNGPQARPAKQAPVAPMVPGTAPVAPVADQALTGGHIVTMQRLIAAGFDEATASAMAVAAPVAPVTNTAPKAPKAPSVPKVK
jgi:hypothetical protein